jgi:outer membrane protein OmpA-like peptidoglycan-associated protein
MFGRQRTPRPKSHDAAENPFWISFSDLMTALMVLFLVAMAVALLGVTQSLRKMDETRQTRATAIQSCLTDMADITQQPQFKGAQLRGQTIEFGPLAEFPKNSNVLDTPRIGALRRFVPLILEASRTPHCQVWFKRFVLEGYASQEGSYLHNLNLSLERSQRVLCILLDAQSPDAPSLADRQAIRELFLVGGSSFNSVVVNSPEKSRRVELRLEFKDLRETESPTPIPWDDDFKCPVVSH